VVSSQGRLFTFARTKVVLVIWIKVDRKRTGERARTWNSGGGAGKSVIRFLFAEGSDVVSRNLGQKRGGGVDQAEMRGGGRTSSAIQKQKDFGALRGKLVFAPGSRGERVALQ